MVATPRTSLALSSSALLLLGACGMQAPAPASSSASSSVSVAASVAATTPVLALVERAVDGDTLLLSSGDRVRILGIDTPEVRDDSAALRALAESAKSELARLVAGRHVRLITDEPLRDRYERLLAYVEIDDEGLPVDVGERMIQSSLARAYPSNHPRLERYLAVEARARAGAQGVWAPDARRAWGPRAEAVITPAQAGQHLDTIARVEGRLTSAKRTEKALFLTLEGGGASLKVVSFQPHFFPPELVASWMNRDVAATGKLQSYKDAPELVVQRPDQIEIPASESAPAPSH